MELSEITKLDDRELNTETEAEDIGPKDEENIYEEIPYAVHAEKETIHSIPEIRSDSPVEYEELADPQMMKTGTYMAISPTQLDRHKENVNEYSTLQETGRQPASTYDTIQGSTISNPTGDYEILTGPQIPDTGCYQSVSGVDVPTYLEVLNQSSDRSIPSFTDDSTYIEILDKTPRAINNDERLDNPARSHPDFSIPAQNSTQLKRNRMYLGITMVILITFSIAMGVSLIKNKGNSRETMTVVQTTTSHPVFYLKWGPWTSWNACDRTCNGRQSRSRTCNVDSSVGCRGPSTDSRVCNHCTDCYDVYNSGVRQSGAYTVRPQGSPSFQAYCDMEDGGWTIMLKRFDGSERFRRRWSEYKQGFGNLSHEFWLGNDHIHYLTNQKSYTLKVEYVTWNTSQYYYVTYNSFRIEDEKNKYKLHVSGFNGNGTDGLYGHGHYGTILDGMYFSTRDRNYDRAPGVCGMGEGFWYNACSAASPTGLYRDTIPCMFWYRHNCTRTHIWKLKPND